MSEDDPASGVIREPSAQPSALFTGSTRADSGHRTADTALLPRFSARSRYRIESLNSPEVESRG
jgi:hypothetical protein